MNIEIPLFVLKMKGLSRPRYLVLQIELRGMSNTSTIVYAQTFYSRSRAEKAIKEADARLRVWIGNKSIGSRKPAVLVKLPLDGR